MGEVVMTIGARDHLEKIKVVNVENEVIVFGTV
jgi:hypothetical protein